MTGGNQDLRLRSSGSGVGQERSRFRDIDSGFGDRNRFGGHSRLFGDIGNSVGELVNGRGGASSGGGFSTSGGDSDRSLGGVGLINNSGLGYRSTADGLSASGSDSYGSLGRDRFFDNGGFGFDRSGGGGDTLSGSDTGGDDTATGASSVTDLLLQRFGHSDGLFWDGNGSGLRSGDFSRGVGWDRSTLDWPTTSDSEALLRRFGNFFGFLDSLLLDNRFRLLLLLGSGTATASTLA